MVDYYERRAQSNFGCDPEARRSDGSIAIGVDQQRGNASAGKPEAGTEEQSTESLQGCLTIAASSARTHHQGRLGAVDAVRVEQAVSSPDDALGLILIV